MKYVFYIVVSLMMWSINLSAATMKSASSVWYFLAQCKNSAESNSVLDVEYKFYHKYEMADIGPIPVLDIVLYNKTNQTIYISLAHSKVLRNGRGASIHQGAIAIRPNEKKELSGILLFQPGMESLFGNIFRFKENLCLSNKLNLECGDIRFFKEEETPFTIGGSIVYSAYADFSEALELKTVYYVDKVVGSKWNKFSPSSQTDYNSMNKTYPNWNNPSEKYIRLWVL